MRMSDLAQASGLPVATVKYYLREGLLTQGRKVSSRLAEYDEGHLRRLSLLRLLREVGGVPVEGLRRLVRVIGTEGVSVHETFSEAANALAPVPPPPGPLREATRELADQVITAAGWEHVGPGSIDRENLAAVLEKVAGYDTHPRDPGEVTPYVELADQIARYEIGHLDGTKDRQGLLEEMVVGQVVFGELLATLRRLAEEHHSYLRFNDDHRD